MTALEALIKQQEQFERITPKNLAAITKIFKQQKHLDNILPKSFVELSNKISWAEKINQITYSIPKQSTLLNLNNIALENNLSKIAQSFKWLDDFQKISKPFKQFDNLFKFGSTYNFIERDLAKIFEVFDEEDVKNEIETQATIIITEAQRVKEIIREIYLNNQKLFSIQPREFEKIIAELLSKQGFEVELTKQTKDNGYDILALKYIDNFSPIKYLVECKKYSLHNKVGVEIIRSFKEVISTEQANKGIIVTTSYFTLGALQKQKESPYLLDYKNKDEVINWVNDYMTNKTQC